MKTGEKIRFAISAMRGRDRGSTFSTDYLVLRAHSDSPQQPPLLFAEDAVNLPHRREVQLVWWPINIKEVSLVIIHAAASHFNTEGEIQSGSFLAADFSVLPGLFLQTCHTLFIWISKTIQRFI